MKKVFRGDKLTKVSVCAALLAVAFGLGACGPKVDDAGDRSSEPSMSTEAEVPSNESTETVDSSESEDMNSSDDMKSDEAVEEPTETAEPVVVEFTCTADDVIALVEDLSAKYTQIPKEEIAAFVFSANFDELTDADKDSLVSTYGSYEELSQNFYNYCMHLLGVCNRSQYFHEGMNIELTDDMNYKNWPKHSEFILNPEKKSYADKYDERCLNFVNGINKLTEKGPQKDNFEVFFENRDGLSLTFASLDFQLIMGVNYTCPNVFSKQLDAQKAE